MIAASEPPADDIAAAVMVLRLLYKANTLGGRPEILPYTDFHSVTISQKAALREEYRRWRQVEGAPVSRTKRLVSYCQARVWSPLYSTCQGLFRFCSSGGLFVRDEFV